MRTSHQAEVQTQIEVPTNRAKQLTKNKKLSRHRRANQTTAGHLIRKQKSSINLVLGKGELVTIQTKTDHKLKKRNMTLESRSNINRMGVTKQMTTRDHEALHLTLALHLSFRRSLAKRVPELRMSCPMYLQGKKVGRPFHQH